MAKKKEEKGIDLKKFEELDLNGKLNYLVEAFNKLAGK